ncbi:Nn.00g050870.m01.CDS01 [Neocucurbitaria sp. VM-36]
MDLKTLPMLLLWTFLASFPLLSAMALPSTVIDLIASPPPSLPIRETQLLSKRCDNKLQNASFESGESPWLAMVSGSWSTRGIYTSATGGHQGSNFYYAQSNSTIDSTLTISQSNIDIANGATVECAAWLASRRPGNVGSTRVEVFLDGLSCGMQYLGTTGWTRVGGKVSVSGDGAIHTMAVVIVSDEAGDEGWTVWVDDLWVGC